MARFRTSRLAEPRMLSPTFGPDSVDLDQHLEHLELFDRANPIERELVLADVRVDVQVDLAAGGGSCCLVCVATATM